MNLTDIIRSRYLEASDTDDRLPSARLKPSTSVGYWPAFTHNFEDKNGWGTERLAEDREFRFRRVPPSMQAINRHAEVMDWTGSILQDPEHRRLAWAWAQCKVRERSFRSWCRRTNRHPRTALCRAQRAYDIISGHFCRKPETLTLPDPKWVFAEDGLEGINLPGSDFASDGPTKSATSWIDPGSVPIDTLTTPEAVEQFERFLARTRKRRRRQQEARVAA